MNKYKILGFLISTFLLFGTTFGYYENKYYCNVSNNSLVVTLNKSNGSQKCLDYIKSINSKIETIDTNLVTINGYLSWGSDVEYWSGIKSNMVAQKQQFVDLKSKIIQYMSSFEWELFLKIKKLLNYYLKSDLKKLNESYSISSQELKFALSSWNEWLYIQTIDKLENIVLKINLITLILNSDKFESMIPYIKHYIQITWN